MSGEVLNGGSDYAIDPSVLKLAAQVKHVLDLGVQVAIVIGGGNFFRGASLSESVSLVLCMITWVCCHVRYLLCVIFDKAGMSVRAYCYPLCMVDLFNRRKAMHHLNRGRVVIFAAGTGNLLVMTDQL